jgi:hypothetical protein
VDDDLLARSQARRADETAPGGDAGGGDGRRLDVADPLRDGEDVAPGHRAALGVAAGAVAADRRRVGAGAVVARPAGGAGAARHAGLHDDAPAHERGVDAVAHLHHLTSDVHAGDVRQAEAREQRRPLALEEVQAVHARRAHLDDHLARARHGIGEVDELEHLRTTVDSVLDRLHGARHLPRAPAPRTRLSVTAALPAPGPRLSSRVPRYCLASRTHVRWRRAGEGT